MTVNFPMFETFSYICVIKSGQIHVADLKFAPEHFTNYSILILMVFY